MWKVGLLSCVVISIFVVVITYWLTKWRKPRCNGTLPPGSMGFPLIGETIQLMIPSHSLDLPSFFRTRIQRYGPIFRTSLIGHPVVVSADPVFNSYIYQQEGKQVELWSSDTISKMFGHDGEASAIAGGLVHKYLRSITLNQFGSNNIIKENLIPQIEQHVDGVLHHWSDQASVEVLHESSIMVYDFNAKQMFRNDAKKLPKDIGERLIKLSAGLMAIPINLPGTAHHRCMKEQKMMISMFKDIIRERRSSENPKSGDFLDQAISSIENEKFVTEEFVIQLVFGVLFASGSISGTFALAFKLLAENPTVLDELTAEHDAIMKNRENPHSPLTWNEYKSMTYTFQVINETLRLSNFMPFLLRKVVKDIQMNGYTIPAGWIIMAINSILHLDPDIYNDPLVFNPSRWKDLNSYDIAKSFMPFGGGSRQCSGTEYTKAFMATFFHVLVTKYRWTKMKGGNISRAPILKFGNGVHIKISHK